MTTDRTDIPWGRGWSAATYRGFSGAPASMEPPRARRTWRAPRAVTVAGGVAAALALGLALGFLTRPQLAQPTSTAPMRAVTPSAATMDIEVNSPAPPAAVKSAGKLEVLPPDLARNAPRPVQAYAAPPGPLSARPADVVAAPAPQVAGAEPCAGLRGRAAQLVCADPELAAADRELNQAYRRALRSGIPTEQLRNDQRDWLAIREDAARRSPRAVADVYEQRIEELNRIADEDGPG